MDDYVMKGKIVDDDDDGDDNGNDDDSDDVVQSALKDVKSLLECMGEPT